MAKAVHMANTPKIIEMAYAVLMAVKGLTFYFIDTTYMARSNSIDPDQLAQPCHLIRIYTVSFLVRNTQYIVTE
jgi:hypothetical protein